MIFFFFTGLQSRDSLWYISSLLVIIFFLLFVFLKQAFHSLEWCTLNKRLTQMRAGFQGPKFEISAQELEGMNMVFQCPPVILVNKCCMFLVKTKAAIFDFYTSGRLRSTKRASNGRMEREGRGGELKKKITQANPQRMKLFFFEKRLHKMYFMVLRTHFFVSSFIDNFLTLPYFVHVSIT